MKPVSIARQTLMVALLTGTTVVSSGCSTGGFSLASMNPFARSSSTPEIGTTASPNQALAANGFTKEGPMKTVSAKTKDAFGKTTNAIAGVFRRDTTKNDSAEKADPNDPLRLDNVPDKVDPEVFVANGQLWESTGDLKKATESYTKALEQNGNHAPALTSLARLQFRQGNLNESVTYFNQALAQKPNDAGLHNDLGLALSKLGNQPAAIASLEKALSLQPGTSRYANNLASVRYEAGDPTGALTVLMQNNKPAVAHFNMAYLHFKSGKMDQAKGHLAETMKFEPQSSSDPATGRAVQRSRDMLAQISGVLGPVAQASPQAKIAGGNVPGAPRYTAPIQQTSQAGTTANSVSTAASPAPAASSISLPPSPTAALPAPTTAVPAAKSTSTSQTSLTAPNAKPATSVPAPKWNNWNKSPNTSAATTSGSPVRPSAPAPATSSSTTEAPAATGFSLPAGL